MRVLPKLELQFKDPLYTHERIQVAKNRETACVKFKVKKKNNVVKQLVEIKSMFLNAEL